MKLLYGLDGPLVGSRRKLRRELSVSDLEYADDMAMVADSMDVLEEILRGFNSMCEGMGLTISGRKTKILAVRPVCSRSAPPRSVQLADRDERVEVVEEFEYLGSTIAQDCSLDREIDRRISKASRTFSSLYSVIWCRKRLKVETKLRLFKAVVLATLLYGCETWVLLATHLRRLQSFVMRCLRVILGVSRWDRMRDTELRSLGGLERVEVMIMRRRLRWLGHVERMKESRIPRCLLVCKPAFGKRSAGGQKRRWNDVLMGDLKRCDLLEDWRESAQDRGAWRCFVAEALADLNANMESQEKERKDVGKKRREEGVSSEALDLKCEEAGCNFVGQNRAGLVNHVRQKHGRLSRVMEKCPFCGGSYHKQGFPMHKRFCQVNPNRGRTS